MTITLRYKILQFTSILLFLLTESPEIILKVHVFKSIKISLENQT